jgi:superoxide dismutase, Fe-Mn family
MNKSILIITGCLFLLISCQNKKLTEYNVEVPLPSKEEKLPPLKPEDIKVNEGAFNLYKIEYTFQDLAPAIDASTMEVHYGKHYVSYINNLNKLVKGTEKAALSIEELLKKTTLSETEIRDNAGGYYNHTLYWDVISAKASSTPKDTLESAINATFGGFEEFKTVFRNTAKNHVGSGWVWLIVNKEGKLQVTSTQNNENPLMYKAIIPGTPLLVIDMWEHAYYLTFQQRKKDYINAFFEIINWDKVGKKFETSIKK